MSLRVSGGRDFPTRINLNGLKNVDKKSMDTLSAIMLAKAASQGSFEDVAALWAGVNSNANIQQPIEELTAVVGQLLKMVGAEEK